MEVTLEVPDGDYERYKQQFPSIRKTVKCRLVKVLGDNGEQQVICTSLLEAFSGKTATAVKQDIYAKAMMMTMCAALAFPIEERVIKEYKEDRKKGMVKHLRKINRTFAYWSAKGILIGMFIKRMVKRALAVFDKQVEANTEIIRPGRSNPRKKKPPRLYHMNYKDL